MQPMQAAPGMQPSQAMQAPAPGQPLAQPAPVQASPPAGLPMPGMQALQVPVPPSAAPPAAPAAAAPAVTAQPVPSAPLPVTPQPQPAEAVAQPPVVQQPVTQPLSAPLAPAAPPVQAPAPPEASTTGPLTTLPPPSPMPDQAPSAVGPAAGGPLSKLTGAVRGRRAARKPRLAMSSIFADLVDMADIPRSAYAVDEEITGAMCLFKTDGGYEVFSCAEDARHEVRFFEEEEAAYFYLFGVLAAEALRNGRLSPRRS
jgi:hypothetical protein